MIPFRLSTALQIVKVWVYWSWKCWRWLSFSCSGHAMWALALPIQNGIAVPVLLLVTAIWWRDQSTHISWPALNALSWLEHILIQSPCSWCFSIFCWTRRICSPLLSSIEFHNPGHDFPRALMIGILINDIASLSLLPPLLSRLIVYTNGILF